MTRKLASIQSVLNITTIDGADAIETLSVLGWKCVAKKNEFKVGDLGVYFEVDSILPALPEFEFLKDRKYRIRTIKLKGQISQGLFMPLSILPVQKKWKEDDDVTDILGVTKYDPEAELEKSNNPAVQKNPFVKFLMKFSWYRKTFAPKRTKGFPSFARKTDEDRIQLFPRICQEEMGTPFVVNEKLDGQSATYTLERKGRRFEFKVCSRNMVNGNKDSSYWKIATKHNIEKSLIDFANYNGYNTIVLQGEIVGNGIQGNKYGISGLRFFAFNLVVDGVSLPTEKMIPILNNMGIEIVPVLEGNWTLPGTIDEAVQFANGKSVLANTLREGVVVRNYEKGISFKIISPEFLLKWKL